MIALTSVPFRWHEGGSEAAIMLCGFRMDESLKSKESVKMTFSIATEKVMYTKSVLANEGGQVDLADWFQQVKSTEEEPDQDRAKKSQKAAGGGLSLCEHLNLK